MAAAAIAVMALVTLATRVAGPVVMARIGATERLTRFLDALSQAVLMAIVANFLAQGGWRDLAAVGVAVAAMCAFRSALLAMILGAATAAAWLQV
jgi:uncharacterized membrane protein